MSFKVNWNSLETDSLRNWTKDLLTDALNSGKRPNILASNIQIKDLNFGLSPPNFEILEIGELAKDRFRGIFKINYDGDFHLTLHTKVQANPLKIYSDNSLEKEINQDCHNFTTPDFLLSNEAFNIPLDLKLSDIKINGIGIIVFSKTKGLTLVFRNDPLDSIKVSSTFDTVQVLANYLQKQIENQIRDLFRETLPTLIHKLSLKYTLVNESTINDLYKQQQKKEEEVREKDAEDSEDLEDDELLEFQQSFSPNNLMKISSIFNSRESLKLNIPKVKKTIQRCHLDKYCQDISLPNLVNSLYTNLNLSNQDLLLNNHNLNGIPINMLLGHDYNKVDNILKEISLIQSNNYNTTNSKNSIPIKPKRRKIKIKKNTNTKDHQPVSLPPPPPPSPKEHLVHPVPVKGNVIGLGLGHNEVKPFEVINDVKLEKQQPSPKYKPSDKLLNELKNYNAFNDDKLFKQIKSYNNQLLKEKLNRSLGLDLPPPYQS